jgi:hypothetical protein
VTFTYDLFSIEADVIKFDHNTKSIFASGEIEIELSGHREELVGTIKVTIQNGTLRYSRFSAEH